MAIARKHISPPKAAPADQPAPVVPAASDTVAAKRARPDTRTLTALGLLVAGIVFIMLGWYGAAHTNIFTEQIPYLISGGLLGVALIVTSGVVASNASLERETRGLREDLKAAIDALAIGSSAQNPAARRVLVVAGGRAYHVPGCPIPEAKDVSTMTLEEARAARFSECKLCGSA